MLLSAVMPAFNCERYVAAAVRSVQSQTYSDWELVIVDDGSSDGTAQVCARLAEDDTRIRLFSYSHAGRGVARNRCLEHASGELIVMCDADDLSLPDRFQIHAAHFAHARALGISSSSCSIHFSDSMELSSMYYEHFHTDARSIKARLRRRRAAINNTSAAVARWVFEKYGGYDPRLQRSQDYEHYRRFATQVELRCTERPLTLYRSNRRHSDWSYFWRCKKYHWLADQLPQPRPASNDARQIDARSIHPGLIYRGVSLLQFVKSSAAHARSRRRGLSDEDHGRVRALLAALEGRGPAREA